MLSAIESAGRYTAFASRTAVATVLAITRPRECVRQFYVHFFGALPLAGVAGCAIGIVLWLHLRGILVRFAGTEAVQYLPTALALAVILEFAPIGAGLIIAGRSGASLAAELGSMTLTEQIDALTMLGQSPIREIIAPRILALIVALPLLTIFMDYLALLASFAAETYDQWHDMASIPIGLSRPVALSGRDLGDAQNPCLWVPDRCRRLLFRRHGRAAAPKASARPRREASSSPRSAWSFPTSCWSS